MGSRCCGAVKCSKSPSGIAILRGRREREAEPRRTDVRGGDGGGGEKRGARREPSVRRSERGSKGERGCGKALRREGGREGGNGGCFQASAAPDRETSSGPESEEKKKKSTPALQLSHS